MSRAPSGTEYCVAKEFWYRKLGGAKLEQNPNKIMDQKTFDAHMTELNDKQYEELAPLKLQHEEIYDEINGIEAYIAKLRADIYAKRSEATKIRHRIKDIRVKYHNMKHELILARPKLDSAAGQ